MKKTLVALAALAATGAFAQSTVTLSGNTSFGHLVSTTRTAGAPAPVKNVSLAGHDTTNSNRLTFTANEDLGGGLRFTTVVDQRFQATGGFRTTGDLYAQISGDFGAVRIGQYIFASHAGWNAGAANTVSAVATTAQSLSGQAISYTTPTFAGFTGAVALDFDRSNGSVGKDGWGLKLNYAAGPLAAQMSYTLAPRLVATDVASRVTGLAASYDFGVAKVFYNMTDVRAGVTGAASGTAAGNTPGTPNNARKGQSLSASIPVGAAALKVGFMNNKSDAAIQTVDRAMVGIDYSLSKRTVLVAEFSQDKQAVTGADRANNSFVGVRHSF